MPEYSLKKDRQKAFEARLLFPKYFFRPFGPQFGLKIKGVGGGGGMAGPPILDPLYLYLTAKQCRIRLVSLTTCQDTQILNLKNLCENQKEIKLIHLIPKWRQIFFLFCLYVEFVLNSTDAAI